VWLLFPLEDVIDILKEELALLDKACANYIEGNTSSALPKLIGF